MIGTGVFTTLGFQLAELNNTWTIALLWLLGGTVALLGAFSYAEIGTHFPKSGGEYHFLSKLYHPFLGYLSGWVSLTVGFSAPIALAAMAMAAYVAKFTVISPLVWASCVLVVISFIHSIDIRQSSVFQNTFTVLKITLVIAMILFGLFLPHGENAIVLDNSWTKEVGSSVFAVSLVYVLYAFSGWNAAAYIVSEIRQPARNLPRALIVATVCVSILYILLQIAFLNQAPATELKGKLEVGQIVATMMFGERGGQFVSLMVALLLISSISAMIWVGPRVVRAMAENHDFWKFLRKDNKSGIPVRAIWLQTIIALLLLLTGSFEQVLIYSGFTLQLFTTLTVAGVFIIRRKKHRKNTYKSPFYPYVQIAFISISVWMMTYIMYKQPVESIIGIANLAVGAATYYFER